MLCSQTLVQLFIGGLSILCVPQEQASSRQVSACPVAVLTAQCVHHDLDELLAVDLAIVIAIDPSLADHLVNLLSVGFSPRLVMMWELRTRDQIAAIHVEHVDLKASLLSSSESVIFILLASHQLKELGEVNGSGDVYDHVLGLGL